MTDVVNEFLEAARSSGQDDEEDEEDPSRERYKDLKKEEAGTDGKTPAEQRFDELQEKAKKEFAERERQSEEEESEEEEEDDQDQFITY